MPPILLRVRKTMHSPGQPHTQGLTGYQITGHFIHCAAFTWKTDVYCPDAVAPKSYLHSLWNSIFGNSRDANRLKSLSGKPRLHFLKWIKLIINLLYHHNDPNYFKERQLKDYALQYHVIIELWHNRCSISFQAELLSVWNVYYRLFRWLAGSYIVVTNTLMKKVSLPSFSHKGEIKVILYKSKFSLR